MDEPRVSRRLELSTRACHRTAVLELVLLNDREPALAAKLSAVELQLASADFGIGGSARPRGQTGQPHSLNCDVQPMTGTQEMNLGEMEMLPGARSKSI